MMDIWKAQKQHNNNYESNNKAYILNCRGTATLSPHPPLLRPNSCFSQSAISMPFDCYNACSWVISPSCSSNCCIIIIHPPNSVISMVTHKTIKKSLAAYPNFMRQTWLLQQGTGSKPCHSKLIKTIKMGISISLNDIYFYFQSI